MKSDEIQIVMKFGEMSLSHMRQFCQPEQVKGTMVKGSLRTGISLPFLGKLRSSLKTTNLQ